MVANQSALKIILKFLIANKMQNFHHFEPLQKSSLIIVGKIQTKILQRKLCGIDIPVNFHIQFFLETLNVALERW